MKYKILKEIKKRKSPYVFEDKDVRKDKISALIEASRWAPSSFNNQPWNYIFIGKNDKTRKNLENSLMLGNGWAKKAPYLIIVFADPNADTKSNGIFYHLYDTGASVMNLSIEAVHQGLAVHQMAGFYAKKVKKALNIPDKFDIIVVLALGYPANPAKLKDKIMTKLKEKLGRTRTRKPVEKNYFFGKFR